MSDLEATKLCAEAMGWKVSEFPMTSPKRTDSAIGAYDNPKENTPVWYDPLHVDGQAMALVKRFRIDSEWYANEQQWGVTYWDDDVTTTPTVFDADLNRAIVYCVAAMQATK